MIEFMLKINDGDGLNEPVSRYPELLRPCTIPAEPISGWGSHRILVEGSEVSFSDEMFGFQVVFETGDLNEDRAAEIVEDIAANLRNLACVETTLIPL